MLCSSPTVAENRMRGALSVRTSMGRRVLPTVWVSEYATFFEARRTFLSLNTMRFQLPEVR